MRDRSGWTVRILGGLLVVLALAGLFGFGSQGVVELVALSGQRDALVAENQALRDRNAEIAMAIRRLKENPRASEEVARADLGLAKPGEIVYLFKPSTLADEVRDGSLGSGSGSQN